VSAKRSAWKRAQSPDTLVGEHTSNREQVERYGLLAGDAGDQFFQRSGDEQLHHTRPLRTFDGLFGGSNTPEQDNALSKFLGSGNRIENQGWLPQSAHQGKGGTISVHNLMRQRGLDQTAARAKWHSLLEEMDDAKDTTFRHKAHLAERYNKELRPLVNEAVDDAMTAHYEPTPQAQKEARWRAVRHITSMKQLPIGPQQTASQLPM